MNKHKDAVPDVFWFAWETTAKGEWSPVVYYMVKPSSDKRRVVHEVTDTASYCDMDGSARFGALQRDYPKPPPYDPYPEG